MPTGWNAPFSARGTCTIWRYVQLLTGGRQWRGIQGDSAQLGGDVVVDSEGTIRLAYRSYDPTDRPPVTDLLTLLSRIEEERR